MEKELSAFHRLLGRGKSSMSVLQNSDSDIIAAISPKYSAVKLKSAIEKAIKEDEVFDKVEILELESLQDGFELKIKAMCKNDDDENFVKTFNLIYTMIY